MTSVESKAATMTTTEAELTQLASLMAAVTSGAGDTDAVASVTTVSTGACITADETEQQLDSGMGSSDVQSPEVKSLLPAANEDDDDDEEETLMERLVGLTEMFPEEVRNFSYKTVVGLKKCAKGLFSFSCSATWLIFSSSAVLLAPLIFEIERAQMEEAHRNQQKQVLLGPSSTSGGGSSFPMSPPIQR